MKWDIRKFIRQAAAAAVAGAMALSISMPALAETWDLSNGSVYITGYDDYATVIQNRTDGLVAASSNVYYNSGETIELTGTYTGAGPGIKVDLSDGNVPIVLNGAEINATTSEAINVYHNAPSFHKLTLNLQGTNKLSGLYAIYSNEERAGLIFDGSKGGKLEASATGEYVIYAYYATLQNGADLTLQGDQHFMGYYDGGSYRELAAGSGLEQDEGTTLTKAGLPYGIRVSTDGGQNWVEVDSQNYNNILGNGVLSLQEKNDGTYTLFKNDPLDTGLRIDATEAESAGKTVDVWLVSGIGGDLTISGVRNVTMPNLNNSPITGDASITCSGNVEIHCTMAGSLTVNRANDVTVTKNISGDAKISCTGDVEITAKNSKAVGGKLEYTNKSTEEKVMRNGGELSAIVQKDQTVSSPSTSASSITIKTETKYNVTTNSCTLKSDNNSKAFYEGQLVTVEVQEAVDGDINWTVTADGQDVVYSPSANTISFKMPAHDVTVTAVYKKVPTYPVSVIKGSIVSPEGTEFAKDTAVTLKADAAAEGKQFKGWTGFPDDVEFLNDTSAATETVTFRMPAQNVTVTAEYENAAVTPDPDPDPTPDPDPGDDPGVDPGAGTGAGVSDGEMFATGVALTAAGGTVLLGGYFLATELILNHLLPEGTAIPANRAQLALLVWQAAGSPEPAAVPAFADITDTATAKAAQWCVEQGYLKAKADGTFDANGWTPRFQTIQVWNKAFPNGNNQNHAA